MVVAQARNSAPILTGFSTIGHMEKTALHGRSQLGLDIRDVLEAVWIRGMLMRAAPRISGAPWSVISAVLH